MPRRGGEVRAAVKGRALGREEDGHRPAAVARHGLHRLHVDVVDVRALLPIDLHADEVLVHEPGDVLVFERLALHHVTPVTRRVPDREENRLVLALRLGECLVTPRKPVHGIVSVLEQVRTGLVGEAIGHVAPGVSG